MKAPIQLKYSIKGRNRTRKVDRLVQYAQEHVRAPTSLQRWRGSLNNYTGYMVVMTKLVELEPSSFEEEIYQPLWVDVMVEEYDSIMKNNVWEMVSRPKNELVVGSRWIYKVKHATIGSIEKYKARFFSKGFS